MIQFIVSVLGLPVLIALLVAFESLQDVYMQMGLSQDFRNKMKEKVKDICDVDVEDKYIDMFLESFVDNGFQKLDILKTVIWANIGLLVINSIEDNLSEKAMKWKNTFLEKISNYKVPGKFSKLGAINIVSGILKSNVDGQVKKTSDYLHQATMTGSNMMNSTNTSSLPKMYKKTNMDKLSPQEQASYKTVKEMLNSVQASR